MQRISPSAEAFRAAFRKPSLAFAEISWRWSVGATATVLFFFGFFEFLDTLPVTRGEFFFLRTRNPYLVGQAMARILRGSAGRAVMSLALAVLLMALLWILAASLGRIVIVNAVLEYFRTGIGKEVSRELSPDEPQIGSSGSPFGPLVWLNSLRAVVALAAIVGFFGAWILAGFASPAADPQPGLAFFLFLPLGVLIVFAWAGLNWLLSLAGIFAVRNHENALGSIMAAIAFFRERTGAVFAVSTWTGLLHLVVFGAATTAVGFPLGLAGFVPGRLILIAVILITLAYFAVVDWLSMARLAGYICIAEIPEALMKPLPPVPPAPIRPLQTTMDRDEPILSDVPGLVPET